MYALPLIVALIQSVVTWNFSILAIVFSNFSIVSAILILLMVVGAWRVSLQPFFFSLMLASLATAGFFMRVVIILGILSSGPLLSAGDFFFDLKSLVNLLIIIFLWSAVPAAANVRSLLRKHPDIKISRRLEARGGKLVKVKPARREALEDGVAVRAQKRLGLAGALRNRQLLIYGVLPALLIVAAAVVWVLFSSEPVQPPPLDELAQRFERVWNEAAGEEAAPWIASFCAEESKDRMTHRLRKEFERLGWTNERPRIGPPEIDQGRGTLARARYPILDAVEKVFLETSWRYHKKQWCLRGFPEGFGSLTSERSP
jgi:hypothetical protein